MIKAIFSLSMVLAIAVVNGCSSPKNEEGTTVIEDSINVEDETRGEILSQDTMQLEHEVQTLSNEVDSLLKDI